MALVDESPQLPATIVHQLIGPGESRHRDFKRVSGKMVAKALETVCGFANAE